MVIVATPGSARRISCERLIVDEPKRDGCNPPAGVGEDDHGHGVGMDCECGLMFNWVQIVPEPKEKNVWARTADGARAVVWGRVRCALGATMGERELLEGAEREWLLGSVD